MPALITPGANITTNQGAVTLDGVNSQFAKFDTVTANLAGGSFTILNSRNFPATAAFRTPAR